MGVELTGLVTQRRNASSAQIDGLTTLDMLQVIHQEDKRVNEAISHCLAPIARLVDNAGAALNHGGRLVLAGAGASGRMAMLAAGEYAPGEPTEVIAMIAGGSLSMLHDIANAPLDVGRGALDLQVINFQPRDVLVGVTVSGKTPWTWGALQYAREVGAVVAVITSDADSEAAQLADIVIAPQMGAEVVAGFNCPKAASAQHQILKMVTTALAVRSGRTFGNLRVDVPASNAHWAERQIAIVMEAAGCSRGQAKTALENSNHHCKTAILMVLTGLDAWQAHELIIHNRGYLRMALEQASTSA